MSESSLYINPQAKFWTYAYETDISLARDFHKRLPGYHETPLAPLQELAKELGVRAVFVKDESSRLGLPAFKILGASWGTFRAIADQNSLPLTSSLEDVSDAARKAGTVLFAATEGNHGRAVARMGKILKVPVKIFMSKFSDDETCRKIEGEGAQVNVLSGTYDDAVATAFAESQKPPTGLLIQDNAFGEYEQIPTWIVEGYSTLLFEVEEQLEQQNLKPTLIVTPIGVGSLGHAVVAYCKSDSRRVGVLTVEPESAACLQNSLRDGEWKTIDTTATIMNGMNCGTVSPISWPVLSNGVDASVTVSDLMCHQAVQYLHAHGVNAGPCGAATVAALRRVASAKLLAEDSVVVVLSTEGTRGYKIPDAEV